MTRVALCFPGQGSQAAGMAAGLGGPRLDALCHAAGDAGLDLRTALGGTDDELRATEVAQPALVAVELTLLEALPQGLEIVGVAGHSVGEFAAAVAAGALDAADAVRLVTERGRLMGRMRSGAMSALLGPPFEAVERICAEVSGQGAGTVVVANLNAPGQTVVSGDVDAVAAVERVASARGWRRSQRLNVGGAFHSPLMGEAATGFAELVKAVRLEDPRLPVVCNVDAAPVLRREELRARLVAQLVSPVRWIACVERLVALGAELLVEVGPQSVLSGLARRIAPGVAAVSAGTREALRGVGRTVVPT